MLYIPEYWRVFHNEYSYSHTLNMHIDESFKSLVINA